MSFPLRGQGTAAGLLAAALARAVDLGRRAGVQGRRSVGTLGLALAALIAGCASLTPSAGEAERVDGVVADVLELRHADPAAQRRELARAREAFAVRGSDIDRLRLGALLATLPSPPGDEAQAVTLLRPLASRRPQTAIGRFAAFVAAQAAERQRLEQAAQRSQQASRVSEQQAREARQKLDELKSIERSVLEREEQLHIE